MVPDTSPLYLSLRLNGTPTVVVAIDVHKSHFFHLAETTIVAMPQGGRELEGRTYQSLGDAVTRVQRVVPGDWSEDYLHTLEAYCTGDVGRMFRDSRGHRQLPPSAGTAVRTVHKHGVTKMSRYSPELCGQKLTTERSEDGSGEWVSVGLLLPIVPLSMSAEDATKELGRLEARSRQNPRVASRRRGAREDSQLKPKGNKALMDGVPEFAVARDHMAAKEFALLGSGAASSSSTTAQAHHEGGGEPAAKKRKERRLHPRVGHCVFVHGKDAPHRVDGQFEADPPPQVVVPGRTASRKWFRLTPLDMALGEPTEVHYTDMSSLHSRYAEVSARHGPTSSVAAALRAAALQHASAMNVGLDELLRQLC